MDKFLRFAKFSFVGALGIAVQLAALALFNRCAPGHYLYASGAAIEITLLHNFIWHLHYTWRDRRDHATRLNQFVRFHLSNGLVSMLGNLMLMRWLVSPRPASIYRSLQPDCNRLLLDGELLPQQQLGIS